MGNGGNIYEREWLKKFSKRESENSTTNEKRVVMEKTFLSENSSVYSSFVSKIARYLFVFFKRLK